MLRALWRRLRYRGTAAQEFSIDDEIRFHLQQQEMANVAAGMTPEEARRQAGIQFGGTERTREQTHAVKPGYEIDLLVQDVRYAFRGFARRPVLTATVLLTLMLGIGATTAVFSVVDRILFRDPPYPQGGQLVSLGMAQPLEKQEFVLGSFFFDWQDRQQPFQAITAESAVTQQCDLTEGVAQHLSCPHVRDNFLSVFGIHPLLGRSFLPDETKPNGMKVVMLSYALWRDRFSQDLGILQKTIQIDEEPVRVVGVLPAGFEMPRLQRADVLLPQVLDEAAQRRAMPGAPMRGYARLKPGISVAMARAQMEPLFRQSQRIIPPEIRNEFLLKVRSLHDRQTDGSRLAAAVLLGAAIAVLLIACGNVFSLLIAQGIGRRREFAIRSALGASPQRLARQVLIESCILSFTGLVLGCLLAVALLRIFIAIAPPDLPFLNGAHLDLRVLLYAGCVSVISAIVFARVALRPHVSMQHLAGRSGNASGQSRIRQVLMVAQIAASMTLLTAGLLLLQSFRNLRNQQLGITPAGTLVASITLGQHAYPPQREATFFRTLEEYLRFGPGVQSVSISDSLPPYANHNEMRMKSVVPEGSTYETNRNEGIVTYRLVSPGYFATIGIPIVQGHAFTDEERSAGEQVIILSQSLAKRLFPSGPMLGRQLQLDQPQPDAAWYTVVGVAADVKNGGLADDDKLEYYRLRRNTAADWSSHGAWDRTAIVAIRSSADATTTARWLQSQVAAQDAAVPVTIETFREYIGQLAAQPRFEAALVGFFAVTGVLLTIVGLYGMVAFYVESRTHEIGTRMALGATREHVLLLVFRTSLRWVGIGLLLGLTLSAVMSRMFVNLLFHVHAYGAGSFAMGTLLLLGVSLLATLIPAQAAMRVDPVVALRHE